MQKCSHMLKYCVAYGEPNRKGNKAYKDLTDVTWTSLKGWMSSTLKAKPTNFPLFA